MAITEDVKIKVSADTSQASAGFNKLKKETDGLAQSAKGMTFSLDKVTTTLVAVNQGLGVVRIAVRAFKQAWDFTQEGAQIAKLARTVDSALVDQIQEAIGGTVTKFEIMQAVTKKGAEAALADFQKTAAGMGEVQRATAAMESAMGDFWDTVKLGAAETVSGIHRVYLEVMGLRQAMGTDYASGHERRMAQKTDELMGWGQGHSLKVLKGDLYATPEHRAEVERRYAEQERAYQTMEEAARNRAAYEREGGAEWSQRGLVYGKMATSRGGRGAAGGRGGGYAGPTAIPTYGGEYQQTYNASDYYSYGGGAIGGGVNPSDYAGRPLGFGGLSSSLGGGDASKLNAEFGKVNEFATQGTDLAVNAVGAAIDAAIAGQGSILQATKQAVAGQLKAKAVMWGMEAVALGITGQFQKAAPLAALAVAAGAAAAAMGGGGGPSPTTSVPGGGYARPGGYGGGGSGGNQPVIILAGSTSSSQNAIDIQKALDQAKRQGLLPSGGSSRFTS